MEEAKALGNAAFKAQDFPEAIKQFTLAIEADAGNHVLFSNRSAAYAKAGQFTAALLDANKCIELMPDWPKGHSRRGAAYVGLRNWRGAQGAYEAGLQLDPDNQIIQQELDQIKARLSGGGGSAAAAALPQGGSIPGSAPGVASLHACMIFLSLFYFVPLLGIRRSFMCYRAAVGCTLTAYVRALWRSWPKSLATLKDANFLQSQETQCVTICLMMIFSPPLPFALVPMVCYSAHTLAVEHAGTILPKLPALLRDRALWLVSPEGTQMVLAFAAISEVMVGLSAPFTLMLHGVRTLIVSLFYMQYLFKRYHTSFWTQTAVTTLHDKAKGIFHHRFCPSPVGMLFDRLVLLIQKIAAWTR